MVKGLSDWSGVWISGAIVTAWFASLIVLLSHDLAGCSAIVLVPGVLLRTFLHTGLFAIAHDAMHNTVFPHQPLRNRWVGRLALGMYGLLSYDTCRQLHWQHHRFPTQPLDPDYHAGSGEGSVWSAVGWYFRFVSTYLSVRQVILMAVGIGLCAATLAIGAKVSLLNLVLFWILPWCLSSIQLFFFGTYLPHRMGRSGQKTHAARSYYMPEFLSLLACYHFGYHWEHHAYPNIPWYRLPQVARQGHAPSGQFLAALEAVNSKIGRLRSSHTPT